MTLAQIVVLALIVAQGKPTVSQRYVPVSIVKRNDTTCPPNEDRERARNELSSYVQSHLDSLRPLSQCDGNPGWTRIAYLDMTDPVQNCPSPWTLFTSGVKRVCFQSYNSGGSCDSIIYNNSLGGYSQVCGRIIGYQYGNPHGFYPYHSQGRSIDSYYIDGISVTHGQSPRQHIWTFAAGWSEQDNLGSCPCGSPTSQATIPPYIGNNYFCETGTIPNADYSVFYSDDPLWDGEGCGPGHSCECTLHSPPWFTAQLNTSTSDDIEVRICSYEGTGRKNVGIELIELYIK